MKTTGSIRVVTVGWLAVAFLAAASGRIEAAPIPLADRYISFTLNPQPGVGRISFDGGSNPLVGSDLGVLAFTGIATPDHPDEMTRIEEGTLSFSTGPLLGSGRDGREWEFGPGGSLTIRGGIPVLGLPAGTTLLTGSFDGSVMVNGVGDHGLKVQAGAFFNTINPILAAHLGLPSDGTPYFGALATLFAADGVAPDAFASRGYTSGDLTTAPVPEPTAIAIFAVAMAAGLRLRRR